MDYERKHAHTIGAPGFPLPVMRSHTKKVDGKDVVTQELGMVEDYDNCYKLMSAIPSSAAVYGKLIRGLPSRHMLPLLEELLKRSQLGQNNFTSLVRGDPAVGKSYAMIQFCKLRDPRGPMIADVGGQSMQDLLFRVVFSADERASVMQMVNNALGADELGEISLMALDQFKAYIKTEDGKQTIDWNALRADKSIPFEKVDSTLAAIFRLEGWDNKSSSIGFKIQDGPLIVAAKENRDLLVDEDNKSLPDSEMAMQIIAQVLNGESERHLIPLGGKGTYELVNAGKSGQGNLTLFTGNYPKDGTGTRQMSDSWESRFKIQNLAAFTELDWQDRTAALLTNIPLCMMHELARPGEWVKTKGEEDKWVLKNPAEFTDNMLALSTYGMSDDELLRVKEWQTSLIANWEETLPAIRKLGSFFHKWSQLVDPDSPLHKAGTFPDIVMEIEDIRSPTTKITPRTMIRHINDAQVITPEAIPPERSGGFNFKRDWNTPLSAIERDAEPISARFGTRLVAAVMDELNRGTADKPYLRAQLMEDAKEAGLLGDTPTLAKALNIDPAKDKTAEAKNAQNLLSATLRRAYPDVEFAADDETLLPLRFVQAQLDLMRTHTDDRTISPCSTRLYVPHTDVDAIQDSILREVGAESPAAHESLADAQRRLPADKLVSMHTLLTALALPVVGKKNLSALWNTALTNGAFAPTDDLAIAQNATGDSSGIATTSILCRSGEEADAEYVTLHVLRNSKVNRGRTVVIGDHVIGNDMYDRLKRNKIIYINRSFEGADVWINSEVRNMVEPRFEADVKKAFLLRNEVSENASLAELLSDPAKSTVKAPNFITNVDAKEFTFNAMSKNSVASRLV